ncbi:SDR family NAD(P)-dependent oxidoreductase [Sporomusa aerivorans]|uniref:SDR family NAD(P)-dependent oxidoreductase n=1 Tax=Sporomusa aerivorans TaxID=204936 RepID=UPI003529ED0F
MGKLTGQTAIITGAARGLGRAYALHLAKLGANIGVIDISLRSFQEFQAEADQLTADTVVEELRALGIKAIGAEADISSQQQVFAAVQKISNELGDVSILICNAGGGMGPLTEGKASAMDLDIYHKVVARNVDGTVYTVTAAAPMMKKNRAGKIVTVASVGGQMANFDGTYAHYSMSKAAIIHYTKLLANELGPYGINVNCIAPGYISTARLKTGFAATGEEKFLRNVSLQRFGTPEDCAYAIEFLTTNMSDYVTGHVLEVNGGTNSKVYIK